MKICWCVLIIALLSSAELLAEGDIAKEAHPGEAPYMEYCASCHDQGVYKTPSRMFTQQNVSGHDRAGEYP